MTIYAPVLHGWERAERAGIYRVPWPATPSARQVRIDELDGVLRELDEMQYSHYPEFAEAVDIIQRRIDELKRGER